MRSTSLDPERRTRGVRRGRGVENTEAIRVVVIDHDGLFRTGVLQFLENEGIAVVGQAASGEDGIRAVASCCPDVVAMAIQMPGMSGIEATRRVIELSPGARVLVFTASDDDGDVLRAIAAGASGYLLKGAPLDELAEGIRAVAAGGSTISPRAAAPLLRELRAHADEAAVEAALPPALSEREVAVLKLMMRGEENTQIGQRLFISTSTVKDRISAILEKLGVANRVQAAVCAVRAGLG
ncbi:MAG: response regulator transcription factor [Actinomycetota bacterium]|nr:response regulator transcription factor [Actinomycetota bacterium]